MDFDQNPIEVLRQLNISSCEEIWHKGTPKVDGRSVIHRNNGFVLRANAKSKKFETCLLRFLRQIRIWWDLLKENCYTELSIGVYVVGDDVPPLHLPKEAIRLLADMGAAVDIDLYFLPDDKRF